MDNASYTVKEIVYYVYFAVMLFAKGIGLYEGMTAFNFCLVFSTGILLLKMAMDSYTVREIVCMAALAILGFIIWRKSGEKGPFLYILLLIGMKGIPVKRVFHLGLIVWGSAFALQVILALTGVRSGVVIAHKKLGLGHVLRWSLGYPHPNVLHISYVILIAFLLYVFRLEGRKLVKATLFCFVGNLYIFLYSVSYTGFIFATIYLICNLYLNLRKNRTRIENILLQALFPCCVLFSVAGPLALSGKWFEFCDKVLNNRFSLSKLFMQGGNWSFFGDRQMRIREESLNYTLDCSYTYLLMFGGIVIFTAMCIGYFLLIRRYAAENKNKELAIIVGLLIAGVSEPFLFNTAYKNLSMVFMGNYLFEVLEKQNWGNFRIQLLKRGDKAFEIPRHGLADAIGRLKAYWKKRARLCVGIGAAAAFLVGIWYAGTADIPDSIYILRKGSDRYEEVVYLDMEDLPKDFHSRIISYKDAETPMYELRGNIVMAEYVRGIISSGLFAGVFACGIYLTIGCLAENKKERLL